MIPPANQLLKVAADEKLFTRTPFSPEWISCPECFNPDLARLPVGLTNLAPGRTPLATSLDLDRQVAIAMGRLS